MVSLEQINDLKARVAKLSASIDVEQRRIDLQNEQERTEEPSFWDNPDEARKQLKKVADIKSLISDFEACQRMVADLDLVPDFLAEGVLSEEEADAQYAAAVEGVEKDATRAYVSGNVLYLQGDVREVTLYDMRGAVVCRIDNPRNAVLLDIEAGIYVVTVSSANGTETIKVVVE
jgi:hypothetical protein